MRCHGFPTSLREAQYLDSRYSRCEVMVRSLNDNTTAPLSTIARTFTSLPDSSILTTDPYECSRCRLCLKDVSGKVS